MPLSDALLDFLEDTLPPAIYDTIFTLLDHLLTVFTSLNSGFAYFLRSAGCVTRHRFSLVLWTMYSPFFNSGDPSDGQDGYGEAIQALLPPVLSVIAIYFAVLSAYHTAASFVRTTVWLVKWGIILGVIAAGTGFFAGRGAGDGIALQDLNLNNVVRFASQLLPDPNANIERAERRRAARAAGNRDARLRPGGHRPSVFDSFAEHDAWKENQQLTEDTQEYVKQVFEAGQKVVKDGSGFMSLVFGRRGQGNDNEEGSSYPAYEPDEVHDDAGPMGRARPRRGRKN